MRERSTKSHRTNRLMSIAVSALATTFLFCGTSAIAQTATTTKDWKQVEDAMGRPGQLQPGDVVRFGMPRKDLDVVLKGVEIKAGLALGSWAAFKSHGSEAMVMGDLVLTEDEVEPVMMKLQEGGIQQSALHNYLLGESPHVMYMHIASHGNPLQMAKAIREALALTKTPAPDASPHPRLPPNSASIRNRSNRSSATLGKLTVESFS